MSSISIPSINWFYNNNNNNDSNNNNNNNNLLLTLNQLNIWRRYLYMAIPDMKYFEHCLLKPLFILFEK